jgi:hypothetical protein
VKRWSVVKRIKLRALCQAGLVTCGRCAGTDVLAGSAGGCPDCGSMDITATAGACVMPSVAGVQIPGEAGPVRMCAWCAERAGWHTGVTVAWDPDVFGAAPAPAGAPAAKAAAATTRPVRAAGLAPVLRVVGGAPTLGSGWVFNPFPMAGTVGLLTVLAIVVVAVAGYVAVERALRRLRAGRGYGQGWWRGDRGQVGQVPAQVGWCLLALLAGVVWLLIHLVGVGGR